MKIKLAKEDLFKCLEFSVKYHLDERKSNTNRTTGQDRGLGAVINDFILGKFIELGVAKAIETFNPHISCKLDFEIHPLNQENSSDPDIVGILEENKERKPNIFIEVKNISPRDRWVGLTKEQLNTITGNSIAKKEGENVFLVYASLGSDNPNCDNDLLGIFLKSETKNELFDNFCNIGEVYCDISHIISSKELLEYGTAFDEGSYFYETNVVGLPIDETKSKKIKEAGFSEFAFKNAELPIVSRNKVGEFKEIGDFFCQGEIVMYVKKNDKSNRVYIDCKTDSVISNKVMGEFILEKDKMYELFWETVGRNPVLKRNNIWIAHRRLEKILTEKVENRLKYISSNI